VGAAHPPPEPTSNVPRPTSHVYRPLSLIEARACHKEVLRVLGDQYADLILICYWTGMRRKDAALIKVEDVWFDDKVLRVRPPHKTRGRGRGPIYIPLFGELLRTLQRRCKGHTGEDWLLPAVAEAQTQQKNRLNKDLPATLRTKAPTNKEGKVALHSFRATFITMMDLAGAPQRVTDRVTAHAPGSIRDRYSKPDIDSARTWMKKAIKPLGATAK
jgi:integrase